MDMTAIFLSTLLVNNIVVMQMLDVSPLFDNTNDRGYLQLRTALTLGVFTASGLGCALWVSYFQPYSLDFLNILTFGLIISVVALLGHTAAVRLRPDLASTLSRFLPLLFTNCALITTAIQSLEKHHSLMEATLSSLGAGIGLVVVLWLFAPLRRRLAATPVPKPFQGMAIMLITAGFAALGFMGFAGLA